MLRGSGSASSVPPGRGGSGPSWRSSGRMLAQATQPHATGHNNAATTSLPRSLIVRCSCEWMCLAIRTQTKNHMAQVRLVIVFVARGSANRGTGGGIGIGNLVLDGSDEESWAGSPSTLLPLGWRRMLRPQLRRHLQPLAPLTAFSCASFCVP